MQSLLPKYLISADSTHFAGVVNEDNVNVILSFKDGTNTKTISDSLKELPHKPSSDNLKKALEYAERSLFSSTNGGRDDAKKTLLVFLERLPTDSNMKTYEKRLTNRDIQVVFVVMNTTANLSNRTDIFVDPVTSVVTINKNNTDDSLKDVVNATVKSMS